MKRLFVLFLAVFSTVVSLSAFPLYPNPNETKLKLANGHTVTLDLLIPKEAVQYFDNSIIQDGFSKLSTTYKLANDFMVSFVPQDSHELMFLVVFDDIPQDHATTLRPSVNSQGLRGISLAAPRDALLIVQAWYKSFLANTSPDKPSAFLATMQKTIFTVDYFTTSPVTNNGVMLIANGVIQNDVVVFAPHLDVSEEYPIFKDHKIDLANPSFAQALQNDSFFIVEPINDPDNPGLKLESVYIYILFDKTAPK